MASIRGSLARLVQAVTLFAARLAQGGVSFLLVLALGAISLGPAIWFAAKKERLVLLGTNKLKFEERITTIKWVAITFGLLALGVLIVAAIERIRRGSFRFPRAMTRVGAWSTGLLATPFALALFDPNMEKDSPKLTLFYCLLAAGAIGVAVYRALGDRMTWDAASLTSSRRKLAERGAAAVAALVVLAMWGAYGWFFTKLAITNHHALTMRTIDLGYYDNIFWQSIRGNFLGCTFIKAGYHGSAHFDPILVLLSPLYLLYPRAELILGLQSVWCGSGVIPVYLIARHHLGSRPQSVLLAACYALHPAVHGANMYEFHSLTLATVPIMWALYALLRRKLWAYWPLLVICLLVREDIPLMMSMAGMYCVLRPEGDLRGTGIITIIVSAIYFVITKAYFMTSSGIIMSGPEAISFAYYYEELIPNKKGLAELLLSLTTNPAFVVAQAFEEAKILFVVTLFLPLLFLPFAARHGRILLVYGLLFCLMASRTAVFSVHFQYTSTLLPFAFFLAPDAIKQLREGVLARAYGLAAPRLQRALVVASFVAALGVSFKFGGIIPNKTFKGGFYPVVRELSAEQQANYDFVQEMVALIPKDASVSASNRMGPHISNRREAYFYGQNRAEYIFLDERELKPDRKATAKSDVQNGKLVELGRRGPYVLYESPGEKRRRGTMTVEPEAPDSPLDVLGDVPQE